MTLNVNAPERLDKFLAQQLPHHSRSKLERMLMKEGVLVDGARVHKGGFKLKAGMEVQLDEPAETPPHDLTPVPMNLDIRWEDEHLLVVNKPRGLTVHPTWNQSAPSLVHGLLARSHGLSHEAGDFRPGIVHRLDRDTTGLLLVAKNDAAHRHLAAQIKAKTAERRYLAYAWGRPDHDEFSVNAAIGRHPKRHTMMAVRADGKPAVTHFRRLAFHDPGCILACRLETGRTHQIRVHLASLMMPVRGDSVYATGEWSKGPMQLHAAMLRFEHPVSGEVVTVLADPPADFIAAVSANECLGFSTDA